MRTEKRFSKEESLPSKTGKDISIDFPNRVEIFYAAKVVFRWKCEHGNIHHKEVWHPVGVHKIPCL